MERDLQGESRAGWGGIAVGFNCAVAQWLEQGTHNAQVSGSNPLGATKFVPLAQSDRALARDYSLRGERVSPPTGRGK